MGRDSSSFALAAGEPELGFSKSANDFCGCAAGGDPGWGGLYSATVSPFAVHEHFIQMP